MYFTSTIEWDNSKTSGYDPYRGRGFLHLTHKGNEDYRTKNATSYLGYKKYSNLDVITTPSLISTSLDNSADSGGWYWKNGVRKIDGSLIDLNNECGNSEEVFKRLTKLIKGSTGEFDVRYKAFTALIKIFKYEEECDNK